MIYSVLMITFVDKLGVGRRYYTADPSLAQSIYFLYNDYHERDTLLMDTIYIPQIMKWTWHDDFVELKQEIIDNLERIWNESMVGNN